MPPIFTAGHSTRTSEELRALLAEPEIEVLVDVRRYPGSRRHPQFSKEALASSLAEAGPHQLDANARVLPGGRLLYCGPEGDQGSLFGDPG